jgi:hypothetical protein
LRPPRLVIPNDMADASLDENSVAAKTGALNTDGITPTRIKVDPTTHAISVSNGTGGSDNGKNVAARDGNSRPVLLGVSSADGKTPVEIYTDSTGALLIQST